tara:strand:- start:14 stop:280 length:267 start_codon:yes stop_codon:yes gene_type:complete
MATIDGKKTGGGSRKGIPNKNTADIKAMINNALTLAGGETYLLRQANENPVAFMGLIGKIIPKEVAAEINGSLTIASIRREIIDPTND